jgi:hypothetical protein
MSFTNHDLKELRALNARFIHNFITNVQRWCDLRSGYLPEAVGQRIRSQRRRVLGHARRAH